jgi:hypothetical protein
MLNESLSMELDLTIIIYKPLSRLEIEYAYVKKGIYGYSSNITVKTRILNYDMREGVIYPVLKLGGHIRNFGGYIYNVTYLACEPIYIPAKREFNLTIVFKVGPLSNGVYTTSLQMYDNSWIGNRSNLLSEYSFGDRYMIEVSIGDGSYIQVSNMRLDDCRYTLIYMYIGRNSLGRSVIHYYDLGATLEKYGSREGIDWIARLGKGLKLMDMALGPYNISFSRAEALRVTILFDGRKGYVIDKSPINISSSDINPEKYVDGYFLKGIILNYTFISPGVIGLGNYSFIRITYISNGGSRITLDLNGTKINSTTYPEWLDNFVFYNMGNKSVIVLPIDIDRFCLEFNQTNPNMGNVYYRLVLDSYRNGKKISGAVEEGDIGRDGVKICIDVVNGLLRVFKVNKPAGFNILDILIGLVASIIIVTILYYHMSRRRE